MELLVTILLSFGTLNSPTEGYGDLFIKSPTEGYGDLFLKSPTEGYGDLFTKEEYNETTGERK